MGEVEPTGGGLTSALQQAIIQEAFIPVESGCTLSNAASGRSRSLFLLEMNMGHKVSNKNKRHIIFSTTNYHCFYCGIEIDEKNWSVDHIIPLKKGGGNGKSNLVPCCMNCNRIKKDKDKEEFREWYSMRKQGIPNFTAEQKEWLTNKGFLDFNPIPETFYGEL